MNSINECNANERIHRRTEINIANTSTCRKTHWPRSNGKRKHSNNGHLRMIYIFHRHKLQKKANELKIIPIFSCFLFSTYILLKSPSVHLLPVNKSGIHFLISEWCMSHLSVKLVFAHFQGIFMSWYTTLISI